MSCPLGEIGAQMARALVRTRVPCECWCNRLVRSNICLPAALGRQGTGLDELSRELTQLLKFGSHQSADLLFQSSNTGDLADAGWYTERKQVTGDVEGTRGEVAPVSVGLHVVGTRQTLFQKSLDALLHFAICGQQRFGGTAV